MFLRLKNGNMWRSTMCTYDCIPVILVLTHLSNKYMFIKHCFIKHIYKTIFTSFMEQERCLKILFPKTSIKFYKNVKKNLNPKRFYHFGKQRIEKHLFLKKHLHFGLRTTGIFSLFAWACPLQLLE